MIRTLDANLTIGEADLGRAAESLEGYLYVEYELDDETGEVDVRGVSFSPALSNGQLELAARAAVRNVLSLAAAEEAETC